MIKTIAHVCLAATDLAASERFYCSALGFRKVFDFIRAGKVFGFYLEVAPGSYVELFKYERTDPKALAPIAHICFETSDIDDLSRRLKAHGCEVTEKSLGADKSWQIWTTDPAGVRIEFHQYTRESSQFTGRPCIFE